MSDQSLQAAERDAAISILRKNDRGGHTVPTDGLYPFQWSWDSAITALGWMRIDEQRAWAEVDTMFGGQWENGMVPHILFHGESGTYFPGPEVWGSGRELPSSAISQPAIWATTISAMLETATDRALATDKVESVLPKLIAYHEWWYRERDPEDTGLVCSYHPWESGMDNSPAWDEALMNVPPVDYHYQRRDLHLVESEQRPTHEQYDRYLYLVDFYKGCGFDSDHIYAHCPYKVRDIGLVATLHRGTKDLLALCDQLSSSADTQTLRDAMARTEAAVDQLWLDDKSCFASRDVLADTVLDEVTTATVLPLFAGLANPSQARAMSTLIGGWLDGTDYGISSTHPDSARFDPQRYWRGPVWLHINWMIAGGLDDYGYAELAERIRSTSLSCIGTGGFWEYFDALSGKGCGGDDFSWTAAIALHWLAD